MMYGVDARNAQCNVLSNSVINKHGKTERQWFEVIHESKGHISTGLQHRTLFARFCEQQYKPSYIIRGIFGSTE